MTRKKRTLLRDLLLGALSVGLLELLPSCGPADATGTEAPSSGSAAAAKDGSEGVAWHEDLEEARREAVRTGKPLLVAVRVNQFGVKGEPDL